jgi:pimeloyl-ACP methyl ester carboxylesterase
LTPIRFGLPNRQLFGAIHLPSAGAVREECVLICNPFGQEAIRCHRLLRVLAERLARSGFNVMRFDYFGTGDSDGEDVEGNMETWVNDVCRANQELCLRSGCHFSAWFGLRLGANLAAKASSRTELAPRHLVLWDPVIAGATYLDELAAADIAAGLENYSARWTIEKRLRDLVIGESATAALGFSLPPSLRNQMRAISAADFGKTSAARVTILNGKTPESVSEITQLMAGRTGNFSVKAVSSDIVWASNEAMNSAIVPADVVAEIISSFVDNP